MLATPSAALLHAPPPCFPLLLNADDPLSSDCFLQVAFLLAICVADFCDVPVIE
jgi:hypothetical protein